MRKPSDKLKESILTRIQVSDEFKLKISKPLKLKHWPFFTICIIGVLSIVILSINLKEGNLEVTAIAIAMCLLLIAAFGFVILMRIKKSKRNL